MIIVLGHFAFLHLRRFSKKGAQKLQRSLRGMKTSLFPHQWGGRTENTDCETNVQLERWFNVCEHLSVFFFIIVNILREEWQLCNVQSWRHSKPLVLSCRDLHLFIIVCGESLYTETGFGEHAWWLLIDCYI